MWSRCRKKLRFLRSYSFYFEISRVVGAGAVFLVRLGLLLYSTVNILFLREPKYDYKGLWLAIYAYLIRPGAGFRSGYNARTGTNVSICPTAQQPQKNTKKNKYDYDYDSDYDYDYGYYDYDDYDYDD